MKLSQMNKIQKKRFYENVKNASEAIIVEYTFFEKLKKFFNI